MLRSGVRYFYLWLVGAKTYSPSIRWRIRCSLRRKGSKKTPAGGEAVAASVSFGSLLSAVAARGWEVRTFKMQISACTREREREREIRVPYVNADVNVRASGG